MRDGASYGSLRRYGQYLGQKMKLLTFTTLYPNAKRPSHGIFVETRITHLVASGEASTRVVAPIPYFPNVGFSAGSYRKFIDVPRCEERHGILIYHPRYALLPKINMTLAPFSLYMAAKRCVSAILKNGYSFDLIDAHYFYPDGVAAILLGQHFNRPVAITARGTDVNLIPKYSLPRTMIRWAAERAAAIITVCGALKNALEDLGVASDNIRVLRNGVDLGLFRAEGRDWSRAHLGFAGTTLLSVGNLIPLKGHDLVIRALPFLPDTQLVIVGDGPQDAELRALAQRVRVAQRVRFLGNLPQGDLPDFYRAADILVLASSREGWPNVVLEAMACGTPVVASNVGGIPEIVATPAVGELMDERSPVALARAVEALLARKPDRRTVRSYAEGFSWDATTRGQLELFGAILRSNPLRQRQSAHFMTPEIK